MNQQKWIGTEPPHVAAIDGARLRNNLLAQLQGPYLESCLILSYRYNDFDLFAGGRRRSSSSTSLVTLLVKAVGNGGAVTLVTRDPFTEPETMPARAVKEWYDGLHQVAEAGGVVKLHPTLHAKVYLFARQGALYFYAAGSSNLTYQGMGGVWTECNIRGYHPADFAEVQKRAVNILNDKRVETLNEWEARIRKSPKGALLLLGRS